MAAWHEGIRVSPAYTTLRLRRVLTTCIFALQQCVSVGSGCGHMSSVKNEPAGQYVIHRAGSLLCWYNSAPPVWLPSQW